MAGTEAQIEIRTNEAMEDVSVRVSGEPEVSLDPCQDTQDGRCWQGPLSLPDTDNHQLIIQGQDAVGKPVLAFGDTSVKRLGEWMEDLSERGDMTHHLGQLPAPAWQLTTPQDSSCEEVDGGVKCFFGGKNEEGDDRGIAFLRPTEGEVLETPQAAVLDEHDRPGTSHRGVAWIAPSRLMLEIHPPLEDLQLCDDEESITKRCPDTWNYDPEKDAPPPPSDETTEFLWRLQPVKHADRCELNVSWTVDGMEQLVSLSIEAAELCDAFVETEQRMPVSGVCAWTLDGGDYDWDMEELPPVIGGPGRSPAVTQYIDCDERQRFRFGGATSYDCRENPFWKALPSWSQDPILPEEEGFQKQQTISVTYNGCQDWYERNMLRGNARNCRWWPYCYYEWVENGEGPIHQRVGYFTRDCYVETVNVLWKPIGDCGYKQHPVPQSMAFPDGAIVIPLAGPEW